MILALVGNQNCGKTTLFNQLTGSNQQKGLQGCGSSGNLFFASLYK